MTITTLNLVPTGAEDCDCDESCCGGGGTCC
jgi:hypothetical protein